jgi:hypothetical protein
MEVTVSTTAPPIGMALAAYITTATGHPCGLDEAPGEYTVEELPMYVVRPFSSPGGTGDWEHTNSNDEQAFFVDIVAGLAEQRRDAEQSLTDALDASYGSIPFVTGPPVLRRYGWTRQDDRVYRGMLIVTYNVSAK